RPAQQQPFGHARHGGLEAISNDPVRSRAVKRQLDHHLLHHRLAMRRRGSDKEHEESSEKYGAGAEGGVWVLLQLSNAPTFQLRFVLEGCAKGQPGLPASIEPAPRQVDADWSQRRIDGNAHAVSCFGSTVQWGGSTVSEENHPHVRKRGDKRAQWEPVLKIADDNARVALEPRRQPAHGTGPAKDESVLQGKAGRRR